MPRMTILGISSVTDIIQCQEEKTLVHLASNLKLVHTLTLLFEISAMFNMMISYYNTVYMTKN